MARNGLYIRQLAKDGHFAKVLSNRNCLLTKLETSCHVLEGGEGAVDRILFLLPWCLGRLTCRPVELLEVGATLLHQFGQGQHLQQYQANFAVELHVVGLAVATEDQPFALLNQGEKHAAEVFPRGMPHESFVGRR